MRAMLFKGFILAAEDCSDPKVFCLGKIILSPNLYHTIHLLWVLSKTAGPHIDPKCYIPH